MVAMLGECGMLLSSLVGGCVKRGRQWFGYHSCLHKNFGVLFFLCCFELALCRLHYTYLAQTVQ